MYIYTFGRFYTVSQYKTKTQLFAIKTHSLHGSFKNSCKITLIRSTVMECHSLNVEITWGKQTNKIVSSVFSIK